MKWAKSGARRGLVAVLAALLCASCSFLPFQNEPSSADRQLV
jgi:hypothetical protein